MRKNTRAFVLSSLMTGFTTVVMQGCLAAAAGAGAEAGYVLTQKDRSPAQTIGDQRITAAVKTKRLADPEVSGLDINVDTLKSDVTLKGVVDNDREAAHALDLARSVSGVRSVRSRLVVQ